ncbi:MAG TPA: O-antigen ligase family protein [Puia sp.]|nr:O-antigen ligase family protein [Puia sp.]
MNEDRFFLGKKLHVYLVLAVVATTLVQWFLVNSLLIIWLTGCRLLYDRGPLVAIRRTFSSPSFWAFFAIFLIDVSGFFHTHDPQLVWLHVQRKATLIAIPFVVSAGPFADAAGFRRLLWSYCRLLAGLSGWCLVVAMVHFARTEDGQVFFYHSLTETLGINAVFYSAYILMGLLFLLSGAAPAGRERGILIAFFTAMMILLASKLLLVVLVVVFAAYLWRFRLVLPRSRVLALVILVVMGTGMLAFTNNPVVSRYKAILPEERQGGFNGVSLRLFIWRSAEDILNRGHAWLWGISSGDSEDRLNQCYIDAGMSVNYLGYNFHNEYIEVLVDDGLMGLAVFLVAMGVLFREGRRTMEGVLVMLVVSLLAGTESILEMQQPLFLACFFPVLSR